MLYMDLLYMLQKSRVTACLPEGDLCQPTSYAITISDPFEDMLDLDQFVKACQVKVTRRELCVMDVINSILYALDGTFQLLDRAYARKKAETFQKDLVDDLMIKRSLRAAKIRWMSPKVDRVMKEIASAAEVYPSVDLIEFMSAYLGVAVAVFDATRKTVVESGWSRYEEGVVMRWDTSGMSILDDDAHMTDRGMRVLTLAQKNEAYKNIMT